MMDSNIGILSYMISTRGRSDEKYVVRNQGLRPTDVLLCADSRSCYRLLSTDIERSWLFFSD
jgi:hypothetical protein